MPARPKSAFLFFCLTLAGGVLAFALVLPRALAFYLPNLLHGAGFGKVAYTLESVGWTHLTLNDVALERTLSAKRLKISFSPCGISAIEAAKLNLSAEIDGDGLSLGPLKLPLTGGGSGPLPGLPRLKLDQAKLHLDTPYGPFQANLNTETEGQATRLRLEAASQAKPALFAPLVLTGLVSENGETISFAGRLNDPMHRLEVRLDGSQNKSGLTGGAHLVLKRIDFARNGLQPKDLFPLLADAFANAEGPLEGEIRLAWRDGKLDSLANLNTYGLSFDSYGANLRNLMGSLTLDRLWPPRTPSRQNFSVGMLTAGVPLGSGSFAFSLEDDGGIFIKRAVLNLADGKLSLEPMRLNPDLTGVLNFKARRVALAKLAPLFQIDGIALDGTVDGEIPVILDKSGIKISAAKLATQDKGFVRYRPQQIPPALQGSGEGVNLMMAALKDFRYDSLALSLDGQAGGETAVQFHIKGRNPDLHDGVPFELNFRLSGPLDRLARRAYDTIFLPESIEAALDQTKR